MIKENWFSTTALYKTIWVKGEKKSLKGRLTEIIAAVAHKKAHL